MAISEPQLATEMLRLVTAGSVDDGKSTLIGRLLYDAKALMADQVADAEVDLARLTDGLRAEREVITRDGMLYMVNEFTPKKDGEPSERKQVRFRTIGDANLTAAVESDADTVEAIVAEIAAVRVTERGATRGDDRVSETSMEDRKREGYF